MADDCPHLPVGAYVQFLGQLCDLLYFRQGIQGGASQTFVPLKKWNPSHLDCRHKTKPQIQDSYPHENLYLVPFNICINILDLCYFFDLSILSWCVHDLLYLITLCVIFPSNM